MISARSAPPVVRVEGLHVSFRRGHGVVHALRGVTLEVRAGEILALVGESGSGKTVLGLTLLGLLPRDPAPRVTGTVMVNGVDVLSASADALRQLRRDHVGAVFQDPTTSLNPTMTIGKQLREVGGSSSAAEEMLRLVGVPDPKQRLRSYPHELSGGQQQRVMIAMAVGRTPSLIVADEPTTALDVTVQAQILELLSSVRSATGAAIIFVTHDLGVAVQIADRVAVLYAGRLLEHGDTLDVLHNPQHPYTRALLRSRLTLVTDRTRTLPQMTGELPLASSTLTGCIYAPRCTFADAQCRQQLPLLRAVSAPGHVAACLKAPFALVDSDDLAPHPLISAVPLDTTGTVLSMVGLEVAFKVRRGPDRGQLVHALRGIDLTLERGETLALVGESGCGKSTLLRVLAGLTPFTAGTLAIEGGGLDVVQMVFQDAGASLTPWLTARELISERLAKRHLSKDEKAARISDALQRVGLSQTLLDAKPSQLSGGQRQRLALARVIVIPPVLLLADEPTSALDVSLAATVLNLLRQLQRDLSMSMIFVTHDIAAARLVADRIAVMYLGRIVEEGSAEDIVSAPVHPYTRALIETVPRIDRPLQSTRGEPASPQHPPLGCAYHPRCPLAQKQCGVETPVLVPFGVHANRAVACLLAGVSE